MKPTKHYLVAVKAGKQPIQIFSFDSILRRNDFIELIENQDLIEYATSEITK
jgi:hypothetical protein